MAVALVGLAAAAHQGWSANLFTLASDMFPRQAVGSVVGFGGMAGAVGGMLIAKLTGYILQTTGSYVPVFLIAAFAYLMALPSSTCSCRAWRRRRSGLTGFVVNLTLRSDIGFAMRNTPAVDRVVFG